ncbi:hypothetical protein K466DRAFT_561485 [Polyporus arcularius HHB13444]|uniref:Uncharacterized protein n=1 Tax=Polyporus arcularius HHB13444 TaxID=1314778 RepID=A0A5C3Q0W5_9APHY|nr:hypothetical protein K466DRAFT_561485 [Polyporus arcularius HHB13444]
MPQYSRCWEETSERWAQDHASSRDEFSWHTRNLVLASIDVSYDNFDDSYGFLPPASTSQFDTLDLAGSPTGHDETANVPFEMTPANVVVMNATVVEDLIMRPDPRSNASGVRVPSLLLHDGERTPVFGGHRDLDQEVICGPTWTSYLI